MTWELRTARSVYVVGAGLVLQHWGDPAHPRVAEPVRHASFETDADVAALEFAAAGTRHAQTSELLVPGGLRLAVGTVERVEGGLCAGGCSPSTRSAT